MEERVWHRAYDADVPASIDYEPIPVTGLFFRSADRRPERTALRFPSATFTYAELAAETRALAAGFVELGVRPGAAAAIQLPNLPQTVLAYHALLSIGARVVLTNPLYTKREILHQWNDAGCEVAVVGDWLWDQKLRALRDEVPVERWVVASIPEYMHIPFRWIAPFRLRRAKPPLIADVDEDDPAIVPFRDLAEAHRGERADVEVDMESTAVLQYTGGTTGAPKGAELTHRNLSCNVQQIDRWFLPGKGDRDVVLSCLPLFHVFGMTVGMNWPLSMGAEIVLMADPRDVKTMVKNLEKHRVTIFPAVPALFNAINHYPSIEDADLSSVSACLSGSAPLPLDVRSRFEELSGCTILEGFGLSETSPVTHVNPLRGRRKVGSIGIPIPDTDARVVPIDGGLEPVEPGAEGELVVRGPQVMRGYWNLPEATAKSLVDGWLRTGDLARVDEEGYFRIVGRKKDMIIAGGYNVYPDEVDDVLVSHPAVLEAATIGVPDERRGETVKTFVVLRPGARASEEELDAHARENLAAYKVPREYEFLDELPKSTVMKVLRRELREREIEKRRGSAPDGESARDAPAAS